MVASCDSPRRGAWRVNGHGITTTVKTALSNPPTLSLSTTRRAKSYQPKQSPYEFKNYCNLRACNHKRHGKIKNTLDSFHLF